MKRLEVIVIGAGDRGQVYTDIMAEYPEKFKIVGVAEIVDNRREYIKKKHGCRDKYCVASWQQIFEFPKFADIAVISTMDMLHFEPAMKALEMGYDILLEKPIAPTPEMCVKIYKQAKKYARKIMVCHVLRYSPYFSRLKKIIENGVLGNVISVEHTEAVGNLHYSNSFVRGNWSNSQQSSCMLLQKCCHDIDILQWLLNKECRKIQSFGSLSYFKEENAPENTPERCIYGCPIEDTCPYNAVRFYYDDKKNPWRETVARMVDPTDADIKSALHTTQYGKCVFRCDNDVVDHQTVNMEFEDKTTATLTMCAFTKGGRHSHFMGTKGELWAEMDAEEGKNFTFYNFTTKEKSYIDVSDKSGFKGSELGHGGGDRGIVLALYEYIIGNIESDKVSEIGISCSNHLVVFAAEEARLTEQVVDVKEYMDRYMK